MSSARFVMVPIVFGFLTGCGGSNVAGTPPPPVPIIWTSMSGATSAQEDLHGFAFYPSSMTINEGDTIMWAFPVPHEPHTVTFPIAGQLPPPGPPDQMPAGGSTYDGTTRVSSGVLMAGQTYSLTFPKAGSYYFFCTLHQPRAHMEGTIVVQRAGSAYPVLQGAYSAQASAAIAADLAGAGASILTFPYPPGGPHLAAGIASGLAAGPTVPGTVFRFLDGATTASNVTVSVGTTVVWTNQANNAQHNVVFPIAGQLPPAGPPNVPPAGGSTYDGTAYASSGALQPGQSYSLTFTKVGTYKYYCLFHDDSGMVGTVTVQ